MGRMILKMVVVSVVLLMYVVFLILCGIFFIKFFIKNIVIGSLSFIYGKINVIFLFKSLSILNLINIGISRVWIGISIFVKNIV